MCHLLHGLPPESPPKVDTVTCLMGGPGAGSVIQRLL